MRATFPAHVIFLDLITITANTSINYENLHYVIFSKILGSTDNLILWVAERLLRR